MKENTVNDYLLKGSRDFYSETVTIVFSCSCPFGVEEDALLVVCGSTESLGRWIVEQAVPLQREPFSEGLWKAKVKLFHTEVEYKYLIISKEGSIIRWENRLNRKLNLAEPRLAAKILEDRFDI
eukprot:jgi/Galph1/509/GphlegSOOS_G5287.1